MHRDTGNGACVKTAVGHKPDHKPFRILCEAALTLSWRQATKWPSPEMIGLWNFSVRVQSWSDKIEFNPVLTAKFFKIISPIQSWSARVKSWIFILPHEVKPVLELFCLEPNMIGWRQNSSSRAFASWCKIDTAFCNFQNLKKAVSILPSEAKALLELFCHEK